MCWSFQASFVSWIIGLVASIILFCRRMPNDITLGVLILTYSSMQLWEALMWADQKCGTLNKVGTILAYFALWSHVLAIGVGLYIEKKVIAPLVIGGAFLLAGVLLMPKKWECSKPGSNRHLKWGFDPSFYMAVFAAAIGLSLYYMRPMSQAITVSAIFIISFLLCLLYAGDTVGSFWCWVSAAFSVIFVVTPYIK
jgi:hypothetical protein